MHEPNIHYHSLRHRERVMKMEQEYQIEKSAEMIHKGIVATVVVGLMIGLVFAIGLYA